MVLTDSNILRQGCLKYMPAYHNTNINSTGLRINVVDTYKDRLWLPVIRVSILFFYAVISLA